MASVGKVSVPVVIAVVMVGAFAVFAIVPQAQLRRAGFDRHCRPPDAAPVRSFAEDDSISFKGGSRIRGSNASVPLVTLQADREWAHLSGVLWHPEVWINREATVRVRRVHTLGGGGIRFEAADGRYDGVLFWTFRPREVLVALGNLGWPIEL